MAELLFSGWGGEDDEDAAEHPLHPPELQDAPSSISTPAVLSVTATKRRDKLDAREAARVATRAAKKERKKAANVLARAAREAAEAPGGGDGDAVMVCAAPKIGGYTTVQPVGETLVGVVFEHSQGSCSIAIGVLGVPVGAL